MKHLTKTEEEERKKNNKFRFFSVRVNRDHRCHRRSVGLLDSFVSLVSSFSHKCYNNLLSSAVRCSNDHNGWPVSSKTHDKKKKKTIEDSVNTFNMSP